MLIGGVIKDVYDILLLIKFQKVRVPPEEPERPRIRVAVHACHARGGDGGALVPRGAALGWALRGSLLGGSPS